MEEFKDYFKVKKNLFNLLILGILILSLPLGINLVRTQQIIRSRAVADPVVFTGANVVTRNGQLVALAPQVSLRLTSTLGPTSPVMLQSGSVDKNTGQEAPMSLLPQGLVKTALAQGACTVSNWSFSPSNPAPNTLIRATVKGVSDPGGWQDVVYKQETDTNWVTPAVTVTAGPTFSFDVNSGSAGTHTVTLGVNKGARACSPTGSYTTGGGTPGPGACSSLGPQSGSPDLGQTCTSCIAAKKSGDVEYIRQYNASCSDQQIVNYMCNGGVSADNQAGCLQVKNGECAGSCGGTPGACTLDPKKLTPDLGPTCTACIATKKSGDVDYVRQYNPSCSNQQIVNYMCNGGVSADNQAGCLQVKNGECAGSCGGTPGGSKDKSGPGTACNLNKPYQGNENSYALWNNVCSGAIQIGGSGIGQGCCELACKADPACDEQFADPSKGPCDANCRLKTASPSPSASPRLSPSPSGSPKSSPSYPPAVSVFTTHFRLAENAADLSGAVWQGYYDGMIVPYTFKDITPGTKTIFVEFKDSNGKTGGCGGLNYSSPCSASIKLVGSSPVISRCSLTFEGSNTVLNLTGEDFGSTRGTVKSDETPLQVRQWKNTSVTAVWQNAPSGQVLPVLLTNSDGQEAEGQCGATSMISFGAKYICRAPSSQGIDNVDLTLVGKFEGGKKVKQKVKIDAQGIISGITEKLEEGKQYILSIKAPRSLKKNSAIFTAGGGVTNIPNFVLPVGDIFPADDADGTINALDKAELNRQWIIAVVSAGRSGDFNVDGRVNSIDWACMRYGFGRNDDPEEEPGPLPTPVASPNPSASASPSPEASPSPSPEASGSPNPSPTDFYASPSPFASPSENPWPTPSGWQPGWW